jgi:hypothetical protein
MAQTAFDLEAARSGHPNRPAIIDYISLPMVRFDTLRYSVLLGSIPRHSHSIVLIESNLLIFLRKNFLYPEDSRQPNRQLSRPFDSRGEFCRSGKSSLSRTIGVDRTISRIHRRNGTYRRGGKTTVRIIRSPPWRASLAV